MDLMNLFTIPSWGLAAFALSLAGTLLAGVIGFRSRRVPAWILALVPAAGAAAFAATQAPETLVTLAMALLSVGLAMVQLLAGALGLAPRETSAQD